MMTRFLLRTFFILLGLTQYHTSTIALPWNNPDEKVTVPLPTMPAQPDEKKEIPTPNVNKAPAKPAILPVEVPTLPRPSNAPSLEYKLKGWYILKTTLEQKKVCYAVNYAIETIGNHTSKRKAYIMITYLSPQQQEISISSGYRYRPHSTLNMSIDGEQYTLITKDRLAWARSAEDDFKIINKLLHGIKVMTKAESVLNTYSVDIYLLDGFQEAYNKMTQICR